MEGSTGVMYKDKTIICVDCNKEFVFTAGEQEFYAAKGFAHEPSRCKPCRAKRKTGRSEQAPREAKPRRELFTVICGDCGQETQVPFRPSQERPAYCRDCYNRRRGH